jgi:hypothetical protein
MIRLERDESFPFIKDDSVRPELSMRFRTECGREVYGLYNDDDAVKAVICVAYTTQIPITVKELDELSMSHDHASFAIFYTVWSYQAGAGREIIFTLRKHLEAYRPNIKRFVTLSPKTTMAYRFHTRNGAIQVGNNKESDNYEYL